MVLLISHIPHQETHGIDPGMVEIALNEFLLLKNRNGRPYLVFKAVLLGIPSCQHSDLQGRASCGIGIFRELLYPLPNLGYLLLVDLA
jgi:hypothetical protein